MTKTNCPAGCGKRFINAESAAQHMAAQHPTWSNETRRKGWGTPYGFADFTKPVTYAEACEAMKKVSETLIWPKKESQS